MIVLISQPCTYIHVNIPYYSIYNNTKTIISISPQTKVVAKLSLKFITIL